MAKGRLPSIEQIEMEARCLDLRRLGYTYERIAETVDGVSDRGHACQIVKRALNRIVREPGEDVLKLELDRLDSALRVAMQATLQGDLRGIDRMLRIMDRRAKYLGLDAPVKVEMEATNDGMIDRLIASEDGALLMAQIEAFVASQASDVAGD